MALLKTTAVGYTTNHAARLLIRLLERELAPLGLSPAYMPVLLALQHRAHSQKALAEAAQVEQPTMTATLTRMERDGWIDRHKNPEDGRSVLASLTPKALAALPKVEAAVARLNAIALSDLDEKETHQLFALLNKVISSLDRSL
ncbi:MarR family transcriptional regulator [Devosia sp. MC532]|uniref:MarR family winged helix-turn-helix transcriptional regulator n=1 Tax=Devosia sp. MC532 TaxID=2799788 RepID=UPI0018F39698|nr:MarR family transcriptional regulator [Devosia sp. MC532]MBJ7579496.1 MarR family transcriptional regulator [Devosia sp. MC532]